MGRSKSSAKREVYSIQSYLKKQETSRINNLTLHLKQLEKEEQKNLKVTRKKEVRKIRSEINEKVMKEVMEAQRQRSRIYMPWWVTESHPISLSYIYLT